VKSLLVFVVACAGVDVPPPAMPTTAPASPIVPADAPPDSPPDATPPVVAPVEVIAATDEVWLRGSTHVHARPSGDSSEPIADVMKWYADRHYDFIVLTDHNQVSEIDKGTDTTGKIALATKPLIVLSGIELTHNPKGCLPAGDKTRECRIHVNALGPTERPGKKVEWANRKTHDRIEKYQSAIDEAKRLGSRVIQINHPQWHWGMTGDILAELVHRGARLVEIANIQFPTWNAGDKDHPSMEQIWDGALMTGVTVFGVASDDAHSYHNNKKDKWPAGGGWIVVHAKRDAQSILDAIAAGHFYASTGVELVHAEVANDELVVEVASADPGRDKIAFVENGKVVATVDGKSARRPLPATGYVRAIVTRDDGKQAWIQPARR
jgi:hypothetical protein